MQEQQNVPSPSTKKFLANPRLALIAAIVVIILTVGGILLIQGGLNLVKPTPPAQQTLPPSPSPQSQTKEVNTEGWQTPLETSSLTGQTYRSEEFGFEVRYPKEWFLVWRNESVLELSNEQRSAVGTGSENSVLLQLIVSRESSLVDLFETLKIASAGIPYEKDLVIYTKLEDFRIGEIPAIRYKADRTAIPYVGLPISQGVLFRKGESVFQVFFLGFSKSALNQHKDLMDQILSTFRFVEKGDGKTEKAACEEAGGTYVGCPANPSPNTGICIPCACPEGTRWAFVDKTCDGR